MSNRFSVQPFIYNMDSPNRKSKILDHRYILHEPIGQGGMGVVYRVTDRLTRDQVALKRIAISVKDLHVTSRSETLTTRDLRLALASEFQVLASLRHPNIISVLDYGFDSAGQPYFTMDYLRDVRTILEYGAGLAVENKVNLLQQLFQALAYLHRRGILHRDLKPGNVLVTGQTVKVLDFGLASTAGDKEPSGGSYAYVAPEVWEKRPFTRAADLYAVGVLAYQLFAGRHPFDIKSHLFIDQVVEKQPDLSLMAIDKTLSQVIGTLLAKDPQRRYAQAADCIAALSQAIGEVEIQEDLAIRESYLQAAAFVGREAELAQLNGALEDALRGKGSAWLIGGESGVGKSRLLDEFRIRAVVQGALLVRGQGVAGSGGLPYQLWRKVIRRLVLNTELDDLNAGVLAAIVPDLEELLARKVARPPVLGGQADQQRLYNVIAQLFRKQTQTVVLLLEDLQWVSESLAVLRHFNQVVADLPLLIVATFRDDEKPDLPDELPWMKHIKLERLSDDEIAALSMAMLGDVGQQSAVLQLLQKETEGNAFFLVETARALAEEAGRLSAIDDKDLPQRLLPKGVMSIIKQRLARVPMEAQPLLQIAAVAGRQLDRKIMQFIALQSHIDLDAWLLACANAAVLEMFDDNWRFTHEKLREGIIVALTPGERTSLHIQVAQALEAVYPDEPDQATLLLYHWQQAGSTDKERRYARLAGEYAIKQYAHSEAVAFLSRALELTPANDYQGHYALLLGREKSYDLQGLREAQFQDLNTLEELAQGLKDKRRQAEVLLRKADYAEVTDDFAGSIAAAQAAIDIAQAIQDLRSEALGYLKWGNALWRQGEFEASKMQLKRALALAQATQQHEIEARSLFQIGNVYAYQGDYAGARPYYEKALPICRQLGLQRPGADTLNLLGNSALEQGDFPAAQSYHQQALSLFRQIGLRRGDALVLCNLGRSSLFMGDYAHARAYFDEALQVSREIRNRESEGLTLYNLSLLFHYSGDAHTAMDYSQQALHLAQEIGSRRTQGYALTNLGHAMLSLENLTQASQFYQQALALRRELGHANLAMESLAGLAQASMLQGHLVQAKAHVDEILGHLVYHSLDGTEYRFWIYLTCCQVLLANQDPRAQIILETSMRLLLEQAAKIADRDLQHSFINQVAAHQEIRRIFAQKETEALGILSAEPVKKETKLQGAELLEHLLAISRRMAEMRAITPLLSFVIDEVLQLVGAERGYIVLINPEKSLDFRVKRNADGTECVFEEDPISHSVLNEVIQTQKSIIVQNALEDPRFDAALSVMVMQLRSIMCAPLVTQSRIIGAIYVENRSKAGQFAEDDLAPLEFFSNQAAVAIENANLNENLESLVEKRTAELVDLNKELEAFSYSVSHDLRAPLRRINGFIEALEEETASTLNEQGRLYMAKIIQSSKRMGILIDGLLAFSRLGRREISKTQVDLGALVQDVIQEHAPEIEGRDLQWHIAEFPSVSGDPTMLRAVLDNLISNALKFTRPRQVAIIEIGMMPGQQDENVFFVRDNGVGFDMAYADKLFGVFQRMHRDDEFEGTGIGLANVRRIINRHGGRTWANAEVDRGATFFFTLPDQPRE